MQMIWKLSAVAVAATVMASGAVASLTGGSESEAALRSEAVATVPLGGSAYPTDDSVVGGRHVVDLHRKGAGAAGGGDVDAPHRARGATDPGADTRPLASLTRVMSDVVD